MCSLVANEQGMFTPTGRCGRCRRLDLPCEASDEGRFACQKCRRAKAKCERSSIQFAPQITPESIEITSSQSYILDPDYISDREWLPKLGGEHRKDGLSCNAGSKSCLTCWDERKVKARARRMQVKRGRLNRTGCTSESGRLCLACAKTRKRKSKTERPGSNCLFLPDGGACRRCLQNGSRCVVSSG